MRKNLFLLIGLYVFIAGMNAQVTERERPKEWQSLIKGGRFMARFLPMQGNITSKDVWGADSVRLRYVDNGIELPATSFWGGNIVQTPDSCYHLFVCGWPENSPKGHMFWFIMLPVNICMDHSLCKTPLAKGTIPKLLS